MKKLLGLLLVMTMAWPVSADVLKNIDIKGEIQTIASDVKHNEADVYNRDVRNRVLVGLSADLVEDVQANFMFQYDNTWDGEVQGDTLNGYQDKTKVAVANVVLSNLFDCFEATIGRQFYGDENSAVMYFGPNHYNAEGDIWAPSLDAAKLTYADDFKALTLIAGKVADRDDDPLGDDWSIDDASLFGADFRLNLTDALTAQIYGYDVAHAKVYDEHGVRIEDEEGDFKHLGFYGAKVAFAPEAFHVSAEYARNFNGHRLIKESKDTGYMVKADAGMNLDAFGVRGTFAYANESFYAFGNYTPGLLVGHVMGGDIWDYSMEGLRMWNLGVDYKLTSTWSFALDGFIFQDRYAHHAETYEADLTAKYTHNEYVQLFAGLGYAKYGTDVDSDFNRYEFGKDNVKGQIGMLINF